MMSDALLIHHQIVWLSPYDIKLFQNQTEL